MARQWFLPDGGMIDEDGVEEYFVSNVGMLNEDQAAAVTATISDYRFRQRFFG